MTRRPNIFFRKGSFVRGLLILLILAGSGNTVFLSGLVNDSRPAVENTSEAEEESSEENHQVTATTRRRSGPGIHKARVRAVVQYDRKMLVRSTHHEPEDAPEHPSLPFKIPLFVLYNQLRYHL